MPETPHKSSFFGNEITLNEQLSIFIRPGSPRWQLRIKFPRHPRIIETTGTTNLESARDVAVKRFWTLKERLDRGLPLRAPSIGSLFGLYKADLEDRHSRKEISRNTKYNYALYVLRDFSDWVDHDRRIDSLSDDDMIVFRDWRANLIVRVRLKANSLNRVLCGVADFLEFCVRKGFLSSRGKPKIKYATVDDEAIDRSQLTIQEYMILRRTSRSRITLSKNTRLKYERQVLDLFIRIQANTGLRTGELARLRWVDLQPARTKSGRKTMIITIKGNKVKNGRAFLVRPHVAHWLTRLRELTGQTEQRPLWPWADFEGSFRRLVIAAGLHVDTHGNHRRLYCLRHSFAIWAALHRRWPTALTARLLGHSPSMHVKTYQRVLAIHASEELIA